ncbi:MAG: VWD domain-containing protein [Methylococcaceae bacterium]|nr:VWD domain-containing protein [Methylococcaceae bacterium]
MRDGGGGGGGGGSYNAGINPFVQAGIHAGNGDIVISYLGSAVGDPHFTTFSGQHFDFQAVGEFVLTRSKSADNAFQVQVRTRPYGGSTATFISEAAAKVGDHRVTFDVDHTRGGGSLVWIDGHPVSLSLDKPVYTLDGGTIILLSPQHYQVLWDTGEILNVTDNGFFLDVSAALSPHDKQGTMDGLLGDNDGFGDIKPSIDTLLPPLSPSELYGSFADAWRVTDATSLFDYEACQTTASFTDKAYPFDPSESRYLNRVSAGCTAGLPEPTSTVLFSLGLLGLIGIRRHKNSQRTS